MNKLPINFLIGFLLGCFISMAYYDGMVAKEYKEKILKSTDALKRYGGEMEKRNYENSVLLYYLDSMIKENEEMRKKISHDHFAL
jgi:hypothetical protein